MNGLTIHPKMIITVKMIIISALLVAPFLSFASSATDSPVPTGFLSAFISDPLGAMLDLTSASSEPGLNEFFFDDGSRGSGGDVGIMRSPCNELYATVVGGCPSGDIAECVGKCDAPCAGYDHAYLMACASTNCGCRCVSDSGCETCGSNLVADCGSLTNQTACEDSYVFFAFDESCVWIATGSSCMPSGQACTPPPCFLPGTKIITVSK